MGVMKRIASGNQPFVVTGIAEVDRALASLEPKMQKKAVRKAMRETGKIVQASARQNLIGLKDGGKLAKSTKVRALKRSRTTTGIGVFSGSDTRDDSTPYYAAWVEFGTNPRWHQSGRYVGFIPNVKFKYLRPALYDNRERIFKVFATEIKRFIFQERGK